MEFPRIDSYDIISLDSETTGLHWLNDEIFGFSLSTADNDYYWDLRQTPKAIDWLYDATKNFNGRIVNHGMKFDLHFFRQAGVDLTNKKVFCTMVRAAIIDENLYEYSLDSVGKKYLGIAKEEPYKEMSEIFGGKATRDAQMSNLHRAPFEIVSPYAKKDTRNALELFLWQEKEIAKQDLWEICSLEDAVLPVLTRMEARGIRVDVKKTEENMHLLEKLIKEKQKEFDYLIGGKININSSPQIRDLFLPVSIEGTNQFRLIDGTICSSTDGGVASIGKKTLEVMTHPAAVMINELRTMMKIHGTFLRDQILGFQQNGWIYPNFKQMGTVNGRFAASEPALQAVPKRNKQMSKLTRSCFLSDEGEEMLRCDFSQSDFRGFVHYTKSPPLIAAYDKDPNSDFHRLVADLMSIPRSPENVGPEGGPNAKQINLGSIFGMGPGKLAKEMGLPYTEEISKRGKIWLKPGYEAEEVFFKYHENIPGVESFNKKASGIARTRGYVISIHGRHLRFPNKNMVYKAPGYLYSSFTSDLCKKAMVLCDKIGGASIKLQVHDEIIFSINDRRVIPEIVYAMENALGDRTNIPIRTSPEVGPNWFDCKKVEI